VDAGADHRATPGQRPQPLRYEFPGGSEDDRGVEGLGRQVFAGSSPGRPQLPRERLRAAVSAPGEGVHLPAFVHRHLADHVRRGAKAVKPQPGGVAGQLQRPVADQSPAQQRRGLNVGDAFGQWQAEALVGHGELSEASVYVAAGEPGAFAQVLSPRPAVPARAVGPPEPRDADAASVGSSPDDLVTEHDRQLRGFNFPIAQVQIGPAHRAGTDPQQQFAWTRLGVGELRGSQRLSGLVEDDGTHASR